MTLRGKPRGNHARKDGGRAFLPDSNGGHTSHTRDTLAESLAETYLASATSGEEQAEDVMNELVGEELGGPFVEDGEPEDTEDPLAPRPARRRSRP